MNVREILKKNSRSLAGFEPAALWGEDAIRPDQLSYKEPINLELFVPNCNSHAFSPCINIYSFCVLVALFALHIPKYP